MLIATLILGLLVFLAAFRALRRQRIGLVVTLEGWGVQIYESRLVPPGQAYLINDPGALFFRPPFRETFPDEDLAAQLRAETRIGLSLNDPTAFTKIVVS